ncbi:uncharacterized protein VICG_00490 [Vittaforma corneae ATCC 50505]|uniref:mRNA guanylyltransferase n=1 Tax=Vittaforma corneae (strain ATCC 50505) TaxID=993615 RepID=L2GNH6_VITCO|nr:uncharacterized protein VICG_00490 [Vittaforma corneae ATCC 50505]ELA42391.1 hypothetical protein VICG_00490 [Vittaforma corneae ATCC 50505]
MIVNDFAKEVNQTRSRELLDALRTVLELQDEIKEFIGSHPVTLSQEAIEYLLNEDYLVCEKTDGIRVMLFVFEGFIYFYDRKNRFYQTDLLFNAPYIFLFDGEMYLEKGRNDKYIFSMFDCLIYDSRSRIHSDLNKRLWYCFQFEKIVQKGFIKRKNDSILKSFYIAGKPMYKSYSFPQILDSISKLLHENDGLIFTPVNEPYLLCARSKIFKWKPPHLNTIDFLIKKTINSGILSLFCNVSGQQMDILEKMNFRDTFVFFDFYFTDDETIDLDNKIGEFTFDFEKEVINIDDLTLQTGGWCLHRIRSDKNTPNNIKIVLDTFDSLKESVKEEDLKKHQEQMMKAYKERASSQTIVSDK